MGTPLVPSALLRLALLLAAPAVLVAGATIVCREAACAAGTFDAAGLALAARGHSPLADAFFCFVTWGGSLLVLGPLALAHGVFAWQRLGSRQAFFVPVALAGAVLMGHAVKMLVARERPALDALVAWSRLHLQVHFPSDIVFALAAGTIWVVALRRLAFWSPQA